MPLSKAHTLICPVKWTKAGLPNPVPGELLSCRFECTPYSITPDSNNCLVDKLNQVGYNWGWSKTYRMVAFQEQGLTNASQLKQFAHAYCDVLVFGRGFISCLNTHFFLEASPKFGRKPKSTNLSSVIDQQYSS